MISPEVRAHIDQIMADQSKSLRKRHLELYKYKCGILYNDVRPYVGQEIGVNNWWFRLDDLQIVDRTALDDGEIVPTLFIKVTICDREPDLIYITNPPLQPGEELEDVEDSLAVIIDIVGQVQHGHV
jgi:hypothetical protein